MGRRIFVVVSELSVEGIDSLLSEANPYVSFYAPFADPTACPSTTVASYSRSPRWNRQQIPLIKATIANEEILQWMILGVWSYHPTAKDFFFGLVKFN